MERKLMALTMAAAMTVGMTAGGSVMAAEVPSELSLYTYYADSAVQIIDETLERLKEIYPDVTVNVEYRTDGDGQVLKTRASVGELSDIFECMRRIW